MTWRNSLIRSKWSKIDYKWDKTTAMSGMHRIREAERFSSLCAQNCSHPLEYSKVRFVPVLVSSSAALPLLVALLQHQPGLTRKWWDSIDQQHVRIFTGWKNYQVSLKKYSQTLREDKIKQNKELLSMMPVWGKKKKKKRKFQTHRTSEPNGEKWVEKTLRTWQFLQ